MVECGKRMKKDTNKKVADIQEEEEERRSWPEEEYPIEKYPVWSVLVFCYKNRRLLNGMLKSIFMQDYPRIRLIVSDDGSSDFDVEDVEKFIDKNKENNIVETIVRRNQKNMGTVKHVIKAMEEAGDYLILTAADDRFATEDVITKYNRVFAANPEAVWLVGKCNVLTPDYQRSIYVAPTVEDAPFFISGDAKRLYSRWTRRGMAVPCSMAFRREAFDLVGGIDTSYTYSEDLPLIFKLLRSNYAPVFIDVITAIHSSGGITNANQAYGEQVRREFYNDKRRLFEQEVEPYLDWLEPEDLRAYHLYKKEIYERNLFLNFEWEHSSRAQKLKLTLSSWQHFWWVVEQQYTKKCKNVNRKKILLYSQLLVLIGYFILSPIYTGTFSCIFQVVGTIDLFVALCAVVFAVVSLPLEKMCKRKAERRRRLVN